MLLYLTAEVKVELTYNQVAKLKLCFFSGSVTWSVTQLQKSHFTLFLPRCFGYFFLVVFCLRSMMISNLVFLGFV